MAEAFAVGDTVREKLLDQTRPVMTIETIAGIFAVCTWTDGKISRSNVFRFDQLEHVSLSDTASGLR